MKYLTTQTYNKCHLKVVTFKNWKLTVMRFTKVEPCCLNFGVLLSQMENSTSKKNVMAELGESQLKILIELTVIFTCTIWTLMVSISLQKLLLTR